MKLLQGSPYICIYKINGLSQDPHVSFTTQVFQKYKSWIYSERTLRSIALTPASKQPTINQSVGGWARQLSEWGMNINQEKIISQWEYEYSRKIKKSETVRRQESEASDSLIIKTPVSKIFEDDQTLMIVLPNFFLGFSSLCVIRSMGYINKLSRLMCT